MCLLWRLFEKVIYMEMGTAINETRDHNGEKHRLLISTDGTFDGKFQKGNGTFNEKLKRKNSKERMEPLLESFKTRNGTFDGKEVMGHSTTTIITYLMESFKRKDGIFG